MISIPVRSEIGCGFSATGSKYRIPLSFFFNLRCVRHRSFRITRHSPPVCCSTHDTQRRMSADGEKRNRGGKKKKKCFSHEQHWTWSALCRLPGGGGGSYCHLPKPNSFRRLICSRSCPPCQSFVISVSPSRKRKAEPIALRSPTSKQNDAILYM